MLIGVSISSDFAVSMLFETKLIGGLLHSEMDLNYSLTIRTE